MSRDVTRHHELRVKEKAREMWRAWHSQYQPAQPTKKWIGQIAHHRGALCSCYRCGNPRRWRGERTLQELAFHEAAKHEYNTNKGNQNE